MRSLTTASSGVSGTADWPCDLRQAREAGGDKDVQIGGGAHTVQQFIRLGHLDELHLHLVPIVLGAGERLLENVGDPRLTPVSVIASPAVTHIKYRVEH